MENNEQHVTQKLFTEILRPQTLDQAIIVPRIREDLSKGLTMNILLQGTQGSGKCLGYNEKIDIYVTKGIYEKYFNSFDKEIQKHDVKVNISIGDLFKSLNIDNDIYEGVQTVSDNIYIQNTDNILVAIQGFVKKKVTLVKYTFDNGNELICSDKHLVINDKNETVKISDTDKIRHMYDGVITKIKEEYIGEGTAYDIAIPTPHLYFTSNGIIHHNTTLTRILTKGYQTLEINASLENGIDTIRDKVIGFASQSSLFGGNEQIKVIVLEECDGLTIEAWKALRATIEKYHNTVRFVANCNYIDKIPEPIQSRFSVISIDPVTKEEEDYLFNGYLERVKYILTKFSITYTDENVTAFVRSCFPDMRSILNKIQNLYNRGCKVLSKEMLASSYDCSELFKLIVSAPDPVANYKQLVSDWSTKADDAVLAIGKDLPDFILTTCPQYSAKLPLILITTAEYNSMLATSIDKFVTLLGLVFKLQMLING